MNTKELDAYLDAMPSRGIPQCELIATLDGKTVYRRSVGMEDEKRNLYYVCSLSKITTCVCAMRLVEEGRIGLDDPVAKYLPAFGNLKVKAPDGSVKPAKNTLTVRHLFTMTGGLNYLLNTEPILRATKDCHAGTLEVVNSFAESPLDFEPGTRFQYSLCHDVLAAVVEVASGVRFSDYAKALVFDPLGMKDTAYHTTEEMRRRILPQYEYIPGVAYCKEIAPHCYFILTDEYDSGGAGLCTSADDQIKLLSALSCDGKTEDGYRLLAPETISLMEKDGLTDEIRRSFIRDRLFGYSWGLCGRVHINSALSCSKTSLGEFGWDGATGGYALVDRKQRFALYFGAHIYGNTYLYNQVHPTLRDLTIKTVLGD